ncbi:MAG: hypothetical protein BGN91_06360 [Nitrobacter sp. 62-13]|jgi:hypothetical protein|nr:MAG: hypothetical protein BGN91_06360 [Nitrobacter sp. 62-13]
MSLNATNDTTEVIIAGLLVAGLIGSLYEVSQCASKSYVTVASGEPRIEFSNYYNCLQSLEELQQSWSDVLSSRSLGYLKLEYQFTDRLQSAIETSP